jgi:CRISPR-associated endonuclease/helicase Cas3
VNTKRDAREIYQASKERLKALDELMDEGCLVHLSTHMCPAHRLETLSKMKDALKAHKRVMCVSTQLIEAGVDIDFATVVRDLAGLDSIAQAAGRCNRNGERTIGRVHIIKMAGSLPTQLNEIRCAQQNARRVLDDWRAVNGDKSFPLSDPEQMRKFFQYHFFERRDQMDYPVKAQKNQRGDTLLRMLGENYLAVDDAQHVGLARNGFMQSFASAAKAFRVIDSPTQGVIVPFHEQGNKLLGELSAAYNLAEEFQLLKKAQQFSVNVFPWEMEALARNGAICEVQKGSGIIRLLDGYYSDEFGLALDGSGRMESMIA